jgi:hypothetical protein
MLFYTNLVLQIYLDTKIVQIHIYQKFKIDNSDRREYEFVFLINSCEYLHCTITRVNINGDLIYSSNWKMEPLELSNVNNRLWTTFFVDEHVRSRLGAGGT